MRKFAVALLFAFVTISAAEWSDPDARDDRAKEGAWGNEFDPELVHKYSHEIWHGIWIGLAINGCLLVLVAVAFLLMWLGRRLPIRSIIKSLLGVSSGQNREVRRPRASSWAAAKQAPESVHTGSPSRRDPLAPGSYAQLKPVVEPHSRQTISSAHLQPGKAINTGMGARQSAPAAHVQQAMAPSARVQQATAHRPQAAAVPPAASRASVQQQVQVGSQRTAPQLTSPTGGIVNAGNQPAKKVGPGSAPWQGPAAASQVNTRTSAGSSYQAPSLGVAQAAAPAPAAVAKVQPAPAPVPAASQPESLYKGRSIYSADDD